MSCTALGNVLAETGREPVLLHSIEERVVQDINENHINTRYFPTLRLHPGLKATTDDRLLGNCRTIFLAIPSVAMNAHLRQLKPHLSPDALLVNLAKGFGNGSRTILECLKAEHPNPVCTL